MNGGYVMVDFTGLNATSESAVTIKGIYNTVFNGMSVNKPMIFFNILSGENGLATPINAVCVLGEDQIIAHTILGTITISSADSVTITQ